MKYAKIGYLHFSKETIVVLWSLHKEARAWNKLVKSAHVDANTPLHQFAKQMMKLLHSRKMKEAKEALGCMVSEKNKKHMFYAIKNKTVLILYCVICRVKRIQLHCICLK
jgi:hypothetical protein